MKKLLLIPVLIFLSGCASGGVDSLCLNIQGTEMSAPYIGGKINANGVMCHMGGVSIKGPQPTYEQLKSIMNVFITNQNSSGKLTIPGPGTITYTPVTAK